MPRSGFSSHSLAGSCLYEASEHRAAMSQTNPAANGAKNTIHHGTLEDDILQVPEEIRAALGFVHLEGVQINSCATKGVRKGVTILIAGQMQQFRRSRFTARMKRRAALLSQGILHGCRR
ncbi:uncharacterized protein ARMOST_22026 [Armillaria ostoyae]|uniref:Uncharacterized protein n=1 Tax=Armillaria ostoyae TaxID=47428 RepID=A0A284SBQ0_ARMOS|nr:uncharacterized protein ARMOST_22026 [Armillaria ostoyae]